MILAAAVWHTWQERNRRVFQQEQSSKIMVFRKLLEDIDVLIKHANGRSPVKLKSR